MSGVLIRDGAALRIVEVGAGRPCVFQHGLGGDAAQVAENVPEDVDTQFVTVECRGQGGSPPGQMRPFSLAMFADDVLAACDVRGLDRFVVGGISMGAAIALRIAVLRPGQVAALVLARPAWLLDPAPDNMRPFREVAALLRTHCPTEARQQFSRSATARMLTAEAPDNFASLLRFFDKPDPRATADLLDDIAGDGCGITRTQVAALRTPALVIGHEVDHVHPMALARTLAELLPCARLVQITPKALDRQRHTTEMRAAIGDFLREMRHPESSP